MKTKDDEENEHSKGDWEDADGSSASGPTACLWVTPRGSKLFTLHY